MTATPAASIVSDTLGAMLGGVTLMTLFGIDHRVFLAAIAGAFFGQSWAPPSAWYSAAIRYVLQSLLSALAATVFQRYYSIVDVTYIQLVAAVVAAFFYPALKMVASLLPAAMREGFKRAFGIDPGLPPETKL